MPNTTLSDYIKGYIVESLPREDVLEHTEKLEEIIAKTNNQLDEYLTVYIRAHIYFCNGKLTINKLVKVIHDEDMLKEYMQETTAKWKHVDVISDADAMKFLLDDMAVKLNSFLATKDIKIAKSIINKKDFLEAYKEAQVYDRLQSLLFRIFNEIKEKSITKQEATEIVEGAVRYMSYISTIRTDETIDLLDTD